MLFLSLVGHSYQEIVGMALLNGLVRECQTRLLFGTSRDGGHAAVP